MARSQPATVPDIQGSPPQRTAGGFFTNSRSHRLHLTRLYTEAVHSSSKYCDAVQSSAIRSQSSATSCTFVVRTRTWLIRRAKLQGESLPALEVVPATHSPPLSARRVRPIPIAGKCGAGSVVPTTRRLRLYRRTGSKTAPTESATEDSVPRRNDDVTVLRHQTGEPKDPRDHDVWHNDGGRRGCESGRDRQIMKIVGTTSWADYFAAAWLLVSVPTRPDQTDPRRAQIWAQHRANVGSNIRALRNERGLTLEALALRSGVARNLLIDVELGRRGLLYERLFDIAEVLGVDAADLMRSRPTST